MLDTIARFFFPAPFKKLDERERQVTALINQRVAEIISHIDPFELIFKEFHGVFSEEFERPEEKLDARSQLSLTMWAYQQSSDPNFKYLLDWIMNSQGNETIKRAAVTTERILYGRAQISSSLLFKKEVKRLGELYEDLMKKPDANFDPNKAAE